MQHTALQVVRAADKLMYVFAGVMSTKGSGADGAAATTHLLNTPRGVAVDANDTVWIADRCAPDSPTWAERCWPSKAAPYQPSQVASA